MKFLVVGDAMVDRYWVGGLNRLNPEKHSAPLLDVGKKLDLPGGAANVAKCLEAMGADVVTLFGKGMIVKNRLVDHQDGVVARFDEEFEGLEEVTLTRIREVSLDVDVVLVSDYKKGSIGRAAVEAIRSLCLPTYVDAKVNPDRWDWATAMFPNAAEYQNHRFDYNRLNCCIVKKGKLGATWLRRGVAQLSVAQNDGFCARNTTGAGDAFFAAFVATYSIIQPIFDEGFNPLERVRLAMMIANAFAGTSTESNLTSTPTWVDVDIRNHFDFPDYLVPYVTLVREGLAKR